ncbi:hypothetical protein C0Q70_00669 [Pomacea canaliculata]|uniref:G-protein coupled receptors family 1 profile domain-containing protein n=1 Tax=Pomacea canaliculata TaxID=400727 RepID=A0A2T7PXC3_POMCA|nr:hypothetical protein C0Q70_00669 [Pomacea canaliculata]
MLDNVTEEQESWLSLSDVSVIFLVVYIVMKGVIFGGNLLTVVTICVDSALHTPAYIFTALLAEADLLVDRCGLGNTKNMYCKCTNATPILSERRVRHVGLGSAQLPSLALLSRQLLGHRGHCAGRPVHRPHRAGPHPRHQVSLHYPLWMTNARAVAVVALSVVASLTYAAIMVNEMSWSPAVCDIWTNTETHDRILKELSPVVLFVPISGCLYLHILTIACRQRAAIAKMHRIRPLPVGPQQTLSWTEARLGRERAESTSAPARTQRPLTLLQEKENVRIHPHGSSTSTLLASTVNPAADLRASLLSAEQLGHGCVKDDAAPSRVDSLRLLVVCRLRPTKAAEESCWCRKAG